MIRSKNDRNDRKLSNKECEIATYKTRAEIIAQNPVREGDDELFDQREGVRHRGHLDDDLKPLEHRVPTPHPLCSPEQRQLPLAARSILEGNRESDGPRRGNSMALKSS
jgi:hypothetical protein